MIVIGLTGSIATGKTFVARCFAKLGVPVFDADQAVHDVLDIGGKAVRAVAQLFPEAFRGGEIDRHILGELVFQNDDQLRALEKIIHPLVHDMQEVFLAKSRQQQHKLVILEIPLLFEKKLHKQCDVVILTIVDEQTQQQRALQRPRMTEEKFHHIKRKQLPNETKRPLCKYVIDTGQSEFSVFRQVKSIVKELIAS